MQRLCKKKGQPERISHYWLGHQQSKKKYFESLNAELVKVFGFYMEFKSIRKGRWV